MTGAVELTDPDPFNPWQPSLNNTTDYILHCDTKRTKALRIVNGRHVYVPHLWIELNSDDQSEMIRITGGASGRIVHVENTLLDGNGHLCDAIKTRVISDTCVIQLKTFRVENLHGIESSVHADVLQSAGGMGELWAEDVTAYTDYAAFQLQREATVDDNNVAWTITGAVRTGNSVVFTANGHGLNVGDYAGVANVSPSGYNGGHTVTARTVNTFTVLLGDLTPAAYTSGGLVQKMAFAYDVGDIHLNRVNVIGLTNVTGTPVEAVQGIRFGARTAPTPPATAINQTAYIKQNEDQTRLTIDAWSGTFDATNFYLEAPPLTANIGLFVAPDTGSTNYSVVRPVLNTGVTPNEITWPNHPQVTVTSKAIDGTPPGGDYTTHAEALAWSSGGGGTPTVPALVQEIGSTTVTATSTTLAATWPGATTTGNFLILGVACGANGNVVTLTPPAGAGWTLLLATLTSDDAVPVHQVREALYYIENAPSQSGAKTFTFGNSVWGSMFLAEFSGVSTLGSLDQQSSTKHTSSTTINSGTTPVTGSVNELCVAIVAANGNPTITAPTNGWTLQDTKKSALGGSTNISAGLLWTVAATTGTQSTAVTLSGAQTNVGKIATFNPGITPAVMSGAGGLVQITGLGANLLVSGVPTPVVAPSLRKWTPRSLWEQRLVADSGMDHRDYLASDNGRDDWRM